MLSSSTPFHWDANPLRSTRAKFKILPQKYLTRADYIPQSRWRSMRNNRFTKKFCLLLKPKRSLLIFYPPPRAARAPFGGPAEAGAGGVRHPLVSILLNGGFGYENLRLRSPLAVNHRL